jgi:VanZ family protein
VWGIGVAAVAVASLLPASSGFVKACGRLPLSDKGLHFSAYAGLAFLAALAFGHGRRLALALCFLILMGLALEFGQKLSPGRSTDMADFAANTAGVALGTLAAWVARAIPAV